MKRWQWGLAFCVILVAAAGLLFSKALDPEVFTGQWYSKESGCVYTFRSGIISCPDHAYMKTDEGFFSGAYHFASDSIVVFAAGVDGLETVRQLYLVDQNGTDTLCDNRNGSGTVFFVRKTGEANPS